MDGIEKVEYAELATFGEYQNVRIGATAYVRLGEDAAQRLAELRAWVQAQLETQVSTRLTQQRTAQEHAMEVERKRHDLEMLEQEIARRKIYAKELADILEKHGVVCADVREIPF